MTAMTPIRTMIVDDEAPARLWLRNLCSKVPDIQVVRECATAAEASRSLRSSAIDLLLLDIQLGPHTGFQVLDGVPYSSVPNLVFVTAHDEYAVKAFDRRAVDYLLKPVREDRFRESIERVRRQLRGGLASEIQAAVRESIGPIERSLFAYRHGRYAQRLTAEMDNAYRMIDCQRIVCLESDGNYIRVTEQDHSGNARFRGTLQSLMDVLDPAQFVRISRFAIVNLAFVSRVERDKDSHLVFVVADSNQRFNVGRAYQQPIRDLLSMQVRP